MQVQCLRCPRNVRVNSTYPDSRLWSDWGGEVMLPGMTAELTYGRFINSCFNNCPDDTRVGSYQGQQQIFCSYATQFATTTIAAKTGAASGATDSTTPQTTMAPSSTTGSGSVSTTASGTASAASKTNSAADVALNAGGILAAVAGVVMAVL